MQTINTLTLFEDKKTVGVELPDSLTLEEWQEFGYRIKAADGSLNWIVGDWLLVPERQEWGRMFNDAVVITGWDYDKLNYCKLTASCFNLVDRSTKLSWSHHFRIASKDGDNSLHWLQQAEDNKWSVRQLVKAIDASKQVEATTSDDSQSENEEPEDEIPEVVLNWMDKKKPEENYTAPNKNSDKGLPRSMRTIEIYLDPIKAANALKAIFDADELAELIDLLNA